MGWRASPLIFPCPWAYPFGPPSLWSDGFRFLLMMFPLPTPLLLCLVYSICTVGNTPLDTHVTDSREHGLQ